MSCNEYKDKLFGYVDGLLEGSEKEAVVSHLESCSTCRDEVTGIEQLQERLVADGGAFVESDFENAVVDRIVREQTFKLRKTERAIRHPEAADPGLVRRHRAGGGPVHRVSCGGGVSGHYRELARGKRYFPGGDRTP